MVMGYQDSHERVLGMHTVQPHSVHRVSGSVRTSLRVTVVALSLALALSIVPSGAPASASPVSQTDCSSSYLYSWWVRVGGSTYQSAYAQTNNFSPGQWGYSPGTG